jgi:hypothetical protein
MSRRSLTRQANAGSSGGVPASPARAAWGSSIPNLASLPLHGDAGGIADLDPDAARAGSIGTVHPLGNDALGAEPACTGKHDRPIFGNVFVKQNASLGIAQQSRQRSLSVQEREIAKILTIML